MSNANIDSRKVTLAVLWTLLIGLLVVLFVMIFLQNKQDRAIEAKMATFNINGASSLYLTKSLDFVIPEDDKPEGSAIMLNPKDLLAGELTKIKLIDCNGVPQEITVDPLKVKVVFFNVVPNYGCAIIKSKFWSKDLTVQQNFDENLEEILIQISSSVLLKYSQ